MKIDLTELYTNRILIFIEVDPLSNKYRQAYINEKQLLAISDVLAEGHIISSSPANEELRHGMQIVDMPESEEEYTLPDLQMLNDEE